VSDSEDIYWNVTELNTPKFEVVTVVISDYLYSDLNLAMLRIILSPHSGQSGVCNVINDALEPKCHVANMYFYIRNEIKKYDIFLSFLTDILKPYSDSKAQILSPLR